MARASLPATVNNKLNHITSLSDRHIHSISAEDDLFSLNTYKNALSTFISNSATPITIALQGEWGSGKTSLMYSLVADLQKESKLHPIWINTWQYSLLTDKSTALLNILRGIISQIQLQFKNKEFLESFIGISKTITKIIGQAVVNNAGLNNVIPPELFELRTDSKEPSAIKELKEQLQELIATIIDKYQIQGFVFFIDDLDRINPVFAVEILEIFTNIFDIENCIFVLAIDYEVVIKGLEPKFGPYSSKNEREFRSFFDKIIQLPFSMPVSSYEIGTFLSEALRKIGYLKGKDLDSNIKDVKNFATLTVGSNPRALKRLINILSLLSLISLEAIKDKDEDYEEEHEQENVNTKLSEVDSSFKVINFAIVCLQVTFPSLYSILESHPDYETWNDTLASQLNLPIVEDSYMKLTGDALGK